MDAIVAQNPLRWLSLFLTLQLAACQKLSPTHPEETQKLTGIGGSIQAVRPLLRPQLLEKALLQKSLLKPMGVKPFLATPRRPTVTKASLLDSLGEEVKKTPTRSRQYWEESMAMSLSQMSLDQPSTPAKIVSEVEARLLNDPQLKKPENRPLAEKIKTHLQKVVDADDLNVFDNTSEATYIIANRLIGDTHNISLGKNAGPLEGLSIEVSPKDLLKSYLLKCEEDYCQASLIKPVSLTRSVPLGLINANVDIVFSQAIDPSTSQFSYELSVDGKWTPIHIGQILAVSISAGFDVKYIPKTQQISIKNARCTVDASCNLPFAKFSAQLNQSGMTFDAEVLAGPLGTHLQKLLPNNGHLTKTIPLNMVQKGLENTIKDLPPSHGQEDIPWSALASTDKESSHATPLETTTDKKKDPPSLEVF